MRKDRSNFAAEELSLQNVHGKNYHVTGTIGQHVLWSDMLTAEEGPVRCSPNEHADLFHAPCGRHGLTGIIVHMELQLQAVPGMRINQTIIKK